MAGKAQAAPPSTEQLLQMIQGQGAITPDGFSVASANPGASAVLPGAGGQRIDPTSSPLPTPAPGAPARPMQEEDDSPARSLYGQQIPPDAQPTPGLAVSATPGSGPPQALDVQLAELRKQLDGMNQKMREDAEARSEAEYQARIAALPDDQRQAAITEHERMLRLNAELKLASMEMRDTHPLFVRTMDAYSSMADIEMDPAEYRRMAAALEPMLNGIIEERLAARRAELDQAVAKQWGVRPTPEQGMPPAPDDPDVTRYKQAREKVRKNNADPAAMRDLITAMERLRLKGIDGSTVV